MGAGVGGIISNQATKDSHDAIRVTATATATAAGAAGGAIAGDIIASGALSPDAEELIIKLDNGQVISVTQEPGARRLDKGDLVWVVRGSERTRVIERTEN